MTQVIFWTLSMEKSSSLLSLSREEQEELARSNKKVKDVKHAGIGKIQASGHHHQTMGRGHGMEQPHSEINL